MPGIDLVDYDGPDPSQRKRVVVAIVLLTTFVLILIIFLAVIFSGSSSASKLKPIAIAGNEIARTAEEAVSYDSARQDTLDFASTANLVGLSTRETLQFVAEEQGYKIPSDDFSDSADDAVIGAFEQAQENNEFNKTYIETLEAMISNTSEAIDEILTNMEDEEIYSVLEEVKAQLDLLLELADEVEL